MQKEIRVTSYFRNKPYYFRLGETWYQRIWRKTVNALKVAFVISLLFGSHLAVGAFGGYISPKTVYQDKLVPVEATAPVLERIAKCESHSSHYCTAALVKIGMCHKSEVGQVLTRANDNKTIDVGKFQINLFYWGSKATELGLNLFNEADNEKMAHYIYENLGTSDWAASQKCWK